MQEENIKTLSLGCRLNALETEKIQNMLIGRINCAVIVNTCAVTAEAERQSAQAIRKISRENPNVPIFATGCAVTRNPKLFEKIPMVIIIQNKDKLNLDVYLQKIAKLPQIATNIQKFNHSVPMLSKQFVQIQNGCNHQCAYCVTRLLRGPSFSFPYPDILTDVSHAIKNGFNEIVLTGVDSASYAYKYDDKFIFISDICKMLLFDIPEIQRLRISSLDPASPQILKIIDLIHNNNKMMPHLHLSMQSGSDTILKSMGRRHNADMVRKITQIAHGVTFGWDVICGFPGETPELFNETVNLIMELKPIKIHAFPFSPRPDTVGATMPNQIPHNISKERVKIISDIADKNLTEYMATQIGKNVSVLVENDNIARTPDDIDVIVDGDFIPQRTICDINIIDIKNNKFIGKKL